MVELTWSAGRRVGATAHTVLLALLLAGCGGGGGGSTDAGGDVSPSASGSTGGGEGGNGENGNGENGEGGFAYVPWGPSDPPIPGQYAALAATAGSPPSCDQLADQSPGGAFWTTVVAVCRALHEDGPWPTGAVPEPEPAPNAYRACLDAELSAMLEQALRWHRDHPGAKPVLDYPATSDRSPCENRIYDVQVLDADAGEDAAGRIPVVVSVAGLTDPNGLTVDGESVEQTGDVDVDGPDEPDRLSTIVVLVPPAAQPRTAQLSVPTEAGPLTASVSLPGTPTPTPTPTPSPTPTPTPTPTASPSPSPSAS